MSFLLLFILFVLACLVIALIARFVSGDGAAAAVALILSGIVAMVTLSIQYMNNYHNDRWLTCHVTSKDRGGQDGTYRVYTDNCGVLSNRDTWFRGKVDSADVWQQINAGQTYRFHVAGARIKPVLSLFPNILEVQVVKN